MTAVQPIGRFGAMDLTHEHGGACRSTRSRRATAAGSTAASSCSSPASSTTSATATPCGSRSRSRASLRPASSSPTSTRASGSPWTRSRDKQLLDGLWESGKAPWTAVLVSRDAPAGHARRSSAASTPVAACSSPVTPASRARGSHYWLLALGAEVTGYALEPDTDPSLFTSWGSGARMDHHIGDVRDLAHLRSVMVESQPEIVLHLAAQPLVRLSYERAGRDVRDQRDGQRQRARGRAQLRQRARHRQRHQRQVLREPRVGVRLPRERRDGRLRPVLGEQGRGRDRDRGLPAVVLRRRRGRSGRDRPRRQRHRRRRLGARPHRARLRARAVGRRADRRAQSRRGPPVAARARAASAPTCGSRSRLFTDGRAFEGAWNFGPAPSGNLTVGEVVDAVVAEWGEGSVDGPRRRHRAARTRPVSSSSTAPRPPTCWTGARVGCRRRRSRETVQWYRDFYGGESGDADSPSSAWRTTSPSHSAGATWTR